MRRLLLTQCAGAIAHALSSVQCPALPGLYSFRGLLSKSEVTKIADMARCVCGSSPAFNDRRNTAFETQGTGESGPCRSKTRWEWHEYESSSRRVAPILADEDSRWSAQGMHPGPHMATASERNGQDGAQAAADTRVDRRDWGELEDFEVFGGVDPKSWLSLSALQASTDVRVQQGAVLLSDLIRHRLPRLGVPHMQVPSFLQLQTLERGCGIMPHIDAATPRAEAVATLGLIGTCQVRVGPVLLPVAAGDMYVLTGEARWHVKHEVLPPFQDRMSCTVRFNASPGKSGPVE